MPVHPPGFMKTCCIYFVGLLLWAIPAFGSPVYYDGFEAQENKEWKTDINEQPDGELRVPLVQVEQQNEGKIQQSAEHARSGKFALKMTVPHEFGDFRTEVSMKRVSMGSEYWYGFSIYLPVDWQTDSQTNILAQWHALLGDAKKYTHKGDTSNRPPVAIAVEGKSWVAKVHWNSNGWGSVGENAGEALFKLGEIQPGVWVDFVVHAKWTGGPDGVLQIWKDGKMLVDRIGPNEYSENKEGPYFKIGIYHPQWKTFRANGFSGDAAVTRAIVVYDDEVRVSPAPATYDDVKPKGEHPF